VRRFDVVVLGDVNPDLILASAELEPAWGQAETLVDEAELVVGGSGAIFACAAARLGLRVSIVGVVGDDLFGRFMRDALSERGVDVSHVILSSTCPTGVGVHLARGADRAILTSLGTIASLRGRDVPQGLLASTRHLHVSSYFLQNMLQPDVPALLRLARRAGATTSLDTNWDPSGDWASGIVHALAEVDIFLPNAEEARALTGLSDPCGAAQHLANTVATVAVKLGADGAAAARGSEFVSVPAPVVDVVDTIGAGDSFDAGFVAGSLRGRPLDECLELAVVTGTLSTRARGGTRGQPERAEAFESARLLY
jgi:sugar/nucleoside kinase (ribokinase family)